MQTTLHGKVGEALVVASLVLGNRIVPKYHAKDVDRLLCPFDHFVRPELRDEVVLLGVAEVH